MDTAVQENIESKNTAGVEITIAELVKPLMHQTKYVAPQWQQQRGQQQLGGRMSAEERAAVLAEAEQGRLKRTGREQQQQLMKLDM